MPVDTFFAYSGVYANVDDAIDDYEAIKLLHTEAGLIDAYDAAVIERKVTARSRSSRSTRPRPGWGGCSAAASDWPPAW